MNKGKGFAHLDEVCESKSEKEIAICPVIRRFVFISCNS
jgi:hypothetical protein